eukprot:3332188-Pleurochrysis_carterae.AAC.1
MCPTSDLVHELPIDISLHETGRLYQLGQDVVEACMAISNGMCFDRLHRPQPLANASADGAANSISDARQPAPSGTVCFANRAYEGENPAVGDAQDADDNQLKPEDMNVVTSSQYPKAARVRALGEQQTLRSVRNMAAHI